MKSQQGSWLYSIRYGFLSYENRLLKFIPALCNSEILINNLMDSFDRLAKLYEHEKYLRRQKITLNLNREAKEYVLIPMRNEEEQKENIVNLGKDK